MKSKVSALLLAAGRGERLRLGKNKILADIGGKPVLAYSLTTLNDHPAVCEIIIAAAAGEEEEVRAIAAPYHKAVKIVTGGVTRQDSVALAFAKVSDHSDLVAIHDAARALLTTEDLNRVLTAAEKSGAAILCTTVKDTIKQLSENGEIAATVPRELLLAAQTPQVFARALYGEALLKAALHNIRTTDDAALIEALGKTVTPVMSHDENLKITTASDFLLAELIISKRR